MTDDYTSLSGTQRRRLLDTALQTYGWVCCICGLPIRQGDESLQHVVPRSRGGETTNANSRPAHRKCNYALGNRTMTNENGKIHNGEAWFTPSRNL